jgi:hypothetical protein
MSNYNTTLQSNNVDLQEAQAMEQLHLQIIGKTKEVL